MEVSCGISKTFDFKNKLNGLKGIELGQTNYFMLSSEFLTMTGKQFFVLTQAQCKKLWGLEHLTFQKCNRKVYQITVTPTKTNAKPQ